MRHARPRVTVGDARSVRVPVKRAEAFYLSAEWRVFRAEVFAERGRRCQDPACKSPWAPGVRILDHVKERKDGGADFDKANVLIRCAPCNGRKTEAARAARFARGAASMGPDLGGGTAMG